MAASPTECAILYSLATTRLYRDNPFRIIGVGVEASAREVGRRVNELEMLAGFESTALPKPALSLGRAVTVDEIHNATQRLRDPEKRLIDELFWFWPEKSGSPDSDAAIEALYRGEEEKAANIWGTRERDTLRAAVATHNLAIAYHLLALDWENYSERHTVDSKQRQDIDHSWSEAIARWKKVFTEDAIWDRLKQRVQQLDDHALTTGLIRRIRSALPNALAAINGQIALSYASRATLEPAHAHVQNARSLQPDPGQFDKMAEGVIAPLDKRLREHLSRTIDRVAKDVPNTLTAVREVIAHAKNVLEFTKLFFSADKMPNKDLFEEVALQCNRLAKPYFEVTNDNQGCLDVIRVLLPLAHSAEARQTIENNIQTLAANLESEKFKPLVDLLTKIQESADRPTSKLQRFLREAKPALAEAIAKQSETPNTSLNEVFDLAAIVLRNISLAAWNNHKDHRTALAASEWALQYARSPEIRTSILTDKQTLTSIAARKKQTLVRWVVGGAVLLFLWILGAINSNNKPQSSRATSLTNSAPNTYTAPSYQSQNTYSTSSLATSVLSQKREAIEKERASVAMLQNQLDTLLRQIESERPYVDQTNSYSVYDFNAKVNRYNALLQQARMQENEFNEMIDKYNSDLKTSGR